MHWLVFGISACFSYAALAREPRIKIIEAST